MELSFEKRAYLIQFQHPEKNWPGLSESALAPLFEVELADFRRARESFRMAAWEAARSLLQDPVFAAKVDRLPFQAGQTLVGLGDSITDDLQSWLEILRDILLTRRPGDQIKVVNAGISGDTTSQVISRFIDVVQQKPDWILCMIGTNDARLHGLSPTKTLVSIEETARNLEMLRNFGVTQTNARWVWMTPSPVIESQIASDWFLSPFQMMWRNEDLQAIAQVIRHMPDPVVDLQSAFGMAADPNLLLADGLHPSLAGQKRIVTALVERLSG
jgi:lysophospholipase L1-like esterase